MPKKPPKTSPTAASNLDVALSLAAIGWHVFPVRSDGSKRPYVLWGDEATTDAETIASWFTGEFTAALVGIHAGKSGLNIVDVDEKGCDRQLGMPNVTAKTAHRADCTGSGHKELALDGHDLPKTFHYRTPSGGEHYVYTAPADIPLTVSQNFPSNHVDTRGGEGYVVYYGPALEIAPTLAPSPEHSLRLKSAPPRKGGEGHETASKPSGSPRTGDDTFDAWRDAQTPGKPRGDAKAARDAVTTEGMGHAEMLEAVSTLIRIGTTGQAGVGEAYDAARATYLAHYPESAKSWDDAAAGSVTRFGLPPTVTTFALSKPQRKEIKRRNANPTEGRDIRRPTVAALDLTADRPQGAARYTEDSPMSEEVAEHLRGLWTMTDGLGILRYDGRVWAAASDLALFEAVRKILKPIVADEVRGAVMRDEKNRIALITTMLQRSRIMAIARLALGILAEDVADLDADPDLLNVQNGVVDLRTGDLLPHDPAYMFTKIAACDYVPGATSADWEKALEAFPSKKVAAYMQVRFGQAITGRTPDDAVMPILRGGGENGKSTILDAPRATLGSYATTLADRVLLANPGDHPTELMDLQGARFTVIEELPEGRNLNVKRLKDMVGTDTLRARRMRQDTVEFPATHSSFISTNYTPIVAETDHGTWRRMMLIDFPWTFLKPGMLIEGTKDRLGDPGLKGRLSKPNEAVLAWLVAGAVDWYKGGMTMPAAPKRVTEDTLEWRTDADPILAYVRDHLVIDPGYAIPVRQLCDDFNRFLEQRSQHAWSDGLITSRFSGHTSLPGVEKMKVRFGLKVKPSAPNASFTAPPPVAVALRGVRYRTPTIDDAFDDIVTRTKKKR
ncbi:MAG: hypothetical protein JWO98_5314 [Frankiales bacterium]|nr:hypothetical protein [Frankiales bacterium]